MRSSKVGRGDIGSLPVAVSSSHMLTSSLSLRARVCEAEDEGEPYVPSVPTPDGISA